MEFTGYDENKVICGVVYYHVVEESNNKYDIGILGFGFNFFV